ncbi:MAG: PQQ-dependent sugar dehydrogenase [Bacteroidales bacterium]
MKNVIILFILIAFSIPPNLLQSQISIGSAEVDTQSVATNLDTPWEILWGPDDHIWFTERYGKVSRLNPDNGDIVELITIDEVHEEGESGLLGMALHPDFPEMPYVYLVYNYLSGSDIEEKLVRYTYENENLSSPVVLIEGIEGNSIHNGSRIVFDDEHKLYFTTGDAGNTSNSQDLNSLNGKTLRMNPDGSIPEDNPFEDSYIWTYGHRNAQGLVISPDGIMYSSEHGPASDDEMNIIEKGRNYGWPEVKGFCDQSSEIDFCDENNVKEPIEAWTPTLAVAGIDYYQNDAIPEWNNSILMATLKESELVQLSLSDNGMSIEKEESWFDNWFGRLRDVCIAPDGRVFIAVSNRDGRGDPKSIDDRIVEVSPVEETSTNYSQSDEEAFKIYPNPVNGDAKIFISGENSKNNLIIYNSIGVKVFEKKMNYTKETIAENSLSKGIYIVVLENEHKKYSKKMIVK